MMNGTILTHVKQFSFDDVRNLIREVKLIMYKSQSLIIVSQKAEIFSNNAVEIVINVVLTLDDKCGS